VFDYSAAWLAGQHQRYLHGKTVGKLARIRRYFPAGLDLQKVAAFSMFFQAGHWNTPSSNSCGHWGA
jgi:hypothetical protein